MHRYHDNALQHNLQGNLADTLTLDKIATVCSVMLIYVMGQFQVAEIFGIKRVLQVMFIVPMVLYALFKVRDCTLRVHTNPWIGLVMLLLINELVYFADPLYIADNFFSLCAIYVLTSVSRHNIMTGVKVLLSLAFLFSVLALLQFAVVLLYPQLVQYARVAIENGQKIAMIPGVSGGGGPVGFNPMMLFGLYTSEMYHVAGFEISRMRSFASEPSLLVVFFVFPSAMGLLMKAKIWRFCSLVTLIFSILSLSGSVQSALLFSFIYFVLSAFLPLKFLFIYTPLTVIAGLLFILTTQGIEPLIAIDSAAGNSDSYSFLSHGNSVGVRAEGLLSAYQQAITSPFGAGIRRELPYSILLSTAISASWFGVLLLLIFFHQVIKKLDTLNKQRKNDFFTRCGISIFFGITCTIFLFNDYAMLTYSGIVLMFLFYRLLQELQASVSSNTDALALQPN